MGLATIDPHGVKEHAEFHEIPKFGVNRPNNKQRYSHLKMSKFTKKCTTCRTAVPDSSPSTNYALIKPTFHVSSVFLTSIWNQPRQIL